MPKVIVYNTSFSEDDLQSFPDGDTVVVAPLPLSLPGILPRVPHTYPENDLYEYTHELRRSLKACGRLSLPVVLVTDMYTAVQLLRAMALRGLKLPGKTGEVVGFVVTKSGDTWRLKHAGATVSAYSEVIAGYICDSVEIINFVSKHNPHLSNLARFNLVESATASSTNTSDYVFVVTEGLCLREGHPCPPPILSDSPTGHMRYRQGVQMAIADREDVTAVLAADRDDFPRPPSVFVTKEKRWVTGPAALSILHDLLGIPVKYKRNKSFEKYVAKNTFARREQGPKFPNALEMSLAAKTDVLTGKTKLPLTSKRHNQNILRAAAAFLLSVDAIDTGQWEGVHKIKSTNWEEQVTLALQDTRDILVMFDFINTYDLVHKGSGGDGDGDEPPEWREEVTEFASALKQQHAAAVGASPLKRTQFWTPEELKARDPTPSQARRRDRYTYYDVVKQSVALRAQHPAFNGLNLADDDTGSTSELTYPCVETSKWNAMQNIASLHKQGLLTEDHFKTKYKAATFLAVAHTGAAVMRQFCPLTAGVAEFANRYWGALASQGQRLGTTIPGSSKADFAVQSMLTFNDKQQVTEVVPFKTAEQAMLDGVNKSLHFWAGKYGQGTFPGAMKDMHRKAMVELRLHLRKAVNDEEAFRYMEYDCNDIVEYGNEIIRVHAFCALPRSMSTVRRNGGLRGEASAFMRKISPASVKMLGADLMNFNAAWPVAVQELRKQSCDEFENSMKWKQIKLQRQAKEKARNAKEMEEQMVPQSSTARQTALTVLGLEGIDNKEVGAAAAALKEKGYENVKMVLHTEQDPATKTRQLLYPLVAEEGSDEYVTRVTPNQKEWLRVAGGYINSKSEQPQDRE